MLKILLYSSKTDVAAFMGGAIKAVLLKVRCSFELSTYHVIGKAVQNVIADPYTYDILLMDANDHNSFLLAQTVRKMNLLASVVFFAGNPVDIHTLLKYRPSGLISETDNPKAIIEGFKAAYFEQIGITSYFTVKNKEGTIKINYRDISYFESSQRVVTLHTLKLDKRFAFYAKLDQLYEKLPKNLFVKCHKSFVVNMCAIERLDKTAKLFILRTGQALEISKRSYAGAAALFESFDNLSI